MIKNSDFFYSKATEFQNKRKEITDAYEKRIEELERAKGSQLYEKESKKAEQTRDANLQALQIEYREYFRIALAAMTETNSKRGVTPPTTEQLAILQALKMRDNVTRIELDRAANSCNNNGLAISIINEIARKNGIMRGYHTETGEMSAEDVNQTIESLRNGLNDFIKHDTRRAARTAAKLHENLYGATGRELPKRPLFTDKESCFNSLLPFGMNKETYTAFCEAVDGEGTTEK